MLDTLAFYISRAVQQGIPLLFGSTGETLTEKSGNLNLGIPGIMYAGASAGSSGPSSMSRAWPLRRRSTPSWRC